MARGYLVDERADHPERQARYRVSPEHAPEQAEPPPAADGAAGGGGLRAVMGGADGGGDGGGDGRGDGGEKKEVGSVERGE